MIEGVGEKEKQEGERLAKKNGGTMANYEGAMGVIPQRRERVEKRDAGENEQRSERDRSSM